MMGIIVPETCRASNKICNKNHPLHLVGILFPHIEKDYVPNLGSISTVEEKKENGVSNEKSEQTQKLLITPIHL